MDLLKGYNQFSKLNSNQQFFSLSLIRPSYSGDDIVEIMRSVQHKHITSMTTIKAIELTRMIL